MQVRVRTAATAAALAGSLALVSACSGAVGNDQQPSATSPGAEPSAVSASSAVLRTNVKPGTAGVSVDTLVSVTAENTQLSRVTLTGQGSGRVKGAISEDGERWVAADRLEPGMRYRLTATATTSDGTATQLKRTFRSQDLTLDEQTYPSIAPLDGETVGIGMPVIVTFDVPVKNRAEFERHLTVTASPAQPGSWHWLSDSEVHWRPKSYWKPGTTVTVDADLNGVKAGNGVYGQEDRVSRFRVGDAVIVRTDVANHQMLVFRNGDLLRTIPISAGKPGFTTRSGIKVIIEKFRSKTMDAATTGISPGDPEYYNISDVEYAQRLTYSGEFIHAAPWSVGDQGSANVSHGCVGMSTENAAWLYSITKRGDVVDVTGTDRPMEPTNGYGDWNVPWKDYKAASALS